MDVRIKYTDQRAEIGREADPPKNANNNYYYSDEESASGQEGAKGQKSGKQPGGNRYNC